MLCKGPHTVDDLARELNLTPNAVRAQLGRLQRLSLVQAAGARPGVRRPHVEYELAPPARELFPKAYEPVLRTLLDVLADRLPLGAQKDVLLEVGSRLVREHIGKLPALEPRRRLLEIVGRLNGYGAGLDVTDAGGAALLRSCGCPLATLTATRPELCSVLGRLLGDALGSDVRVRCDRSGSPQCRFEVAGG